jgi:hypothetical protein
MLTAISLLLNFSPSLWVLVALPLPIILLARYGHKKWQLFCERKKWALWLEEDFVP